MSGKTLVGHKPDQANLPPLTEAQLAELACVAARPDDEIDYSDIPPLTEAFWRNSERGKFYPCTTTAATLLND